MYVLNAFFCGGGGGGCRSFGNGNVGQWWVGM